MTKKEKIENFIEKYNGYLITSLVCSEDISKTYIAKYIKEHGMERGPLRAPRDEIKYSIMLRPSR